MTRVYDPKGNELKPVLLHITERDKDGNPIACRIRFDDEKIKLSQDASDNHFLLLWGDRAAGEEIRLEHLAAELHEVKNAHAIYSDKLKAQDADINYLKGETARVTAENEQKTAELRALQRERDPERMERMIQERIAEATKGLRETLASVVAEKCVLASKVAELSAAKKKLREALERTKEKK